MKNRFIEYDPQGFTLREAILEAQRCLHCAKPLCRTGCPIENEIPDFIGEMARGNLGAAISIIMKRSNLPAVCGRVCPHEKQCEGSCVLTRKGKGIKVGKIERFIADMDGELHLLPKTVIEKRPGKVAVIGSGPAGLTIAGDLAKLGFTITVFDSQPEAGGVLMYGIPEFRLPKQVVRREIEKIKKLGVVFELNTMIGPDLTLDDLFARGYDAIFIGSGNALAKSLPLPGVNLPGVLQATYFLQMVELARQGSVNEREVPINEHDKVVIVGAGNTAVDVARTAIRRGVKSVTILNHLQPAKIAALASEVEAARQEGVEIVSLLEPVAFLGQDYVKGLLCKKRVIECVAGEEVVRTTDEEVCLSGSKIVIAIGQKPASRIIGSTRGVTADKNGFVEVRQNPYGMTKRSGVFAGGDVVNGPATVVCAMKDAKKVAVGIAQYVQAKKLMEKCGLRTLD